MHVAVSSLDQLIDYVMNNPPDGYSSAQSLNTLSAIIQKNKSYESVKM